MRDQTVGACLGNKLTVDVMAGEVVRVFQLSKNTVAPIPCVVPRKVSTHFLFSGYGD